MSSSTTAVIAKPPALAGVAMRGMAWMTVVVIITKLSSFVSQWFLGVLLSPADFGVYALVTVAQNFIEGFRDIGASRILVQRGGEYDRLAGPILKLSLGANAIAVFLLVGGAPFFASYYSTPQLLWLIPLTALAIPWATWSTVQRAKLNRDLNYRAVGRIESIIPLVQNGLMIAFAYAGLGVTSFVLSFLIGSILQTWIYRRAVGPIPRGARLTSALFWEVFHQSKWLMLGAYGMGLVLRGDYLVLGRVFENKTELGIYYFGFQLAASIGVVFTSGLQNVLMPAFSSLASDPARLRNAYLRACRVLLLATTFLAGAFVCVSPELLQFLWHGKWNAAVIVTMAVTFSLPFKLLAPLATSTLEARAMWRERTLLLIVDGVLVCVSAGLGAHFGGVTGAAVAITLQRCLYGLFQACYAARTIGVGGVTMATLLGEGLLPLLAGIAVAWLLPVSFFASSVETGPLFLAAAAKTLAFAAGWLATILLVNRAGWSEMRTLVSRKLKRSPLPA